MTTNDSAEATRRHIERVRELIGHVTVRIRDRSMEASAPTILRLNQIRAELQRRAGVHDRSKTEDPEKEVFDEYTPKLKDTTYGSEQYDQFLKKMKPALDHHYENNRHHPEHFDDGIRGMNIVDLLEMACDWKAASERHDDGDYQESCAKNAERFGYGDQFKAGLSSMFPATCEMQDDLIWDYSSLIDLALMMAESPSDTEPISLLHGPVACAIYHNTRRDFGWRPPQESPNKDVPMEEIMEDGMVRCRCGGSPEVEVASEPERSSERLWFKCRKCENAGPMKFVEAYGGMSQARRCAGHAWNERRLKDILSGGRFTPKEGMEDAGRTEGGFLLYLPDNITEVAK